jgi:hypothetical protein
MRESTLAVLSHRASAAVSRRASLLSLGGAALASLAAPATTAHAGTAGKKAKRKCKRQVGQCRAAWEDLCMGNPNCESDFFACCQPLARCDVAAYLTCVAAVD